MACFASWHDHHAEAVGAVDAGPSLIAHCALETYSVLTRLPPPHRAPADLVVEFLADRFGGAPLTLPPGSQSTLVASLHAAGVTGGASYDGLVAATAIAHDATLVTLDRRASVTYDRMGADYRILG